MTGAVQAGEGRPVALVTGAGRGVGRRIALDLSDAGWSVGLVARTELQLKRVASEIQSLGGRVLAVPCDVSNRTEVEHAVAAVSSQLGPVELLVNNAGSGMAIGPIWDTDPDLWWRDVEINLRGTFLCCRAVLPGMMARKSGRIINVSSYAALKASPFHSAYAASKAGIIRLTEGLAQAVESSGIQVFVISPGNVLTAMTEGMLSAAESPTWFPMMAVRKPEQWQRPEAAGRLVQFLASGQADGLTGRFIHVNDDVVDLAARSAEVRERDLLALRLTGI